jgi:flagellar secretion chaperone FliS
MKNTSEAKLAYRENAVRGATPIELVVILFDAAIDDMRRAVTAIKNGDIEERATAIRHALLVLQQLQGTLDFDRGGPAARQFEQFYNLIRAKLLESQLRNSPELMQQQIQFMSEVRDCWVQAEKQLQPRPSLSPTGATIASARATAADGGSTSEWNA